MFLEFLLATIFAQYVRSNEIYVSPISKVVLETNQLEEVWNVTGCPGCKLVFFCTRRGPNCKDVDVIITHSGKPEYPCSDNLETKKAFVDSNHAQITIINSKTNSIYCNVLSTTPYLDSEEINIDSSEDGMPLETNKPTCRCGWANKKGGRIVGGTDAKRNEYPFAVLVGDNDGFDCAGSIVTPKHVLTAAHCVVNTPMFVSVGNHERNDKNVTIINVEKTIVHEGFISNTYKNDIALLMLEKEIQFSQIIGPVCLPEKNEDIVGKYVKVMGWGRTGFKQRKSNVLKKTYLKILDQDICNTLFPNNMVEDSQLCAYTKGTDSCLGDSGGPLVKLNEKTNMYAQHGIVSFGYKCNTTSPGVNTDVSAYLDWIVERVQETGNYNTCH